MMEILEKRFIIYMEKVQCKKKKKTEEEKMVLVGWVSDGFFNKKKFFI